MRTREEIMYKIVNNNIHITRGETATYNVRLIDKTTGAPFILPKTDANNFVVIFSVRRSDYIKDGYAIKKTISLSDNIILDTTEIGDYIGGTSEWTNENAPTDKTTKKLYKRWLTTGGYDYKYWDGTDYKDYSFEITFPFSYNDTAALSPKSYKYAMTIYGGNNLIINDDHTLDTTTITYKKPLVDAQFIVEADINE